MSSELKRLGINVILCICLLRVIQFKCTAMDSINFNQFAHARNYVSQKALQNTFPCSFFLI